MAPKLRAGAAPRQVTPGPRRAKLRRRHVTEPQAHPQADQVSGRIAERHDLLLVEDDAHGGEPVRLMHLDGGARVIHVASFTKVIGQATRVGLLAASADTMPHGPYRPSPS